MALPLAVQVLLLQAQRNAERLVPPALVRVQARAPRLQAHLLVVAPPAGLQLMTPQRPFPRLEVLRVATLRQADSQKQVRFQTRQSSLQQEDHRQVSPQGELPPQVLLQQ